jgi:hypothetical protein
VRARAGSESLRAVVNHNRPGQVFLLANALPVVVFYIGVSFMTSPEGNWPLAGYITLLALCGGPMAWCYDAARRTARELGGTFGDWQRALWHAACIIGLIMTLGIPIMPWLHTLPVVGRLIPLHRFVGAERMGIDADRIVRELSLETGQAPFVIALHYGRASQLAYYMNGRPVVYCASSYILDGRRTQYDYFAETDLGRDLGLTTRPALAVGGTREAWLTLFERVEPAGTLDGDNKRNRPAFKAYGYKGPPDQSSQPSQQSQPFLPALPARP